MRLYHISQMQRQGYGTYRAAVVAAVDDDHARNMHPYNGEPLTGERDLAWVSRPEDVQVKYLGEAVEGTQAGLILVDYWEE